jgi:tripartite-type tricarboxylate transporter receptor subunit TctC
LKRAELLPAVPTIDQSGVPGFDASTVIGMFVPVGTPRDIIQRLNAALVKALASPALKERLASQGAEARPSTPEELGKFVREDLAKWRKVVQKAGIKLEQ